MKDQNILKLGKAGFGLSFLAGNTCLFGYLITKNFWFADSGFLLLVYGTVVNLMIVSGLLIYGAIRKAKRTTCFQSVGILLINIPIAIIYTMIGITHLK
ncbi:hypothetical protein MP478_21115 [Chryseobacterium sp. WG14]|uniref:hypothetical protein n=1 Tax=unclassified Chryseobacterium TaxID=2593645 RepID=UPI001D1E71DE|nr:MULTISPECIES: hypothetical protein [unclassified Chryseobacterium]MCQ9637473.1 hypothetical protein [Chryseobacterium sp. WG23]MCQ9641890.1 hypothetical protein [Chryseobacterium sp. WG14]CAH0288102.1 hypothetical protein SRABI04_04258 [Chryseobacterium sp. Bi04]